MSEPFLEGAGTQPKVAWILPAAPTVPKRTRLDQAFQLFPQLHIQNQHHFRRSIVIRTSDTRDNLLHHSTTRGGNRRTSFACSLSKSRLDVNLRPAPISSTTNLRIFLPLPLLKIRYAVLLNAAEACFVHQFGHGPSYRLLEPRARLARVLGRITCLYSRPSETARARCPARACAPCGRFSLDKSEGGVKRQLSCAVFLSHPAGRVAEPTS